jgi:homoserine dehydrogenase
MITGSHGGAINPDGLDLQAALATVDSGESLRSLSRMEPPHQTTAFITTCPADLMIETSPVNHQTGQPAIAHIQSALYQAMHVVTANKGPVAHSYHNLTTMAKKQGVRFLFESAVMDGAPIFALFRETLPGAKLVSFRGILNSCTNLLLEMMEAGQSLDEAVAYGRSIGITETDPDNDIDGWDAAIKVAALVTVLMNVPLTPQQVHRRGIRTITPSMIKAAKHAGERWKLVCSAEQTEGRVIASVTPERVGPDSTLYTVSGTSSYIQFKLDVLPGLGVLESDPGPETTAYGLLADVLKIVEAA